MAEMGNLEHLKQLSKTNLISLFFLGRLKTALQQLLIFPPLEKSI